MNSVELSIVIPAYREEENLTLLLPELVSVVKKLNITTEVLVVDTMEMLDETSRICLENGVQYLNREGGNEYGHAVRTGISRATGKWIIFMDADFSHTPEFVVNLFENRINYDVVIASRYVKGGATDNPAILIIMSRIVNLIFSLVLGLNCRDVSNSFKLYLRDEIASLQLVTNNFDIVEEILYKLKLRKGRLRILELPYTFKERKHGTSKRDLLAFILSYGKTLYNLRFNKDL